VMLDAWQHDRAAEIAARHADWTILRADHARDDLERMLYAIEQAITDAPSANAPTRRRRAGPGLASRIRAVVRSAPCPSACTMGKGVVQPGHPQALPPPRRRGSSRHPLAATPARARSGSRQDTLTKPYRAHHLSSNPKDLTVCAHVHKPPSAAEIRAGRPPR
jgi:hypothetical protein